jgi:hypothetical protein
MNSSTVAWLPLLVLLITIGSPSDAWAYIDPGTGSYLFQMLIAGVLAGAYTLRRYWGTVRSWFGRRDTRK